MCLIVNAGFLKRVDRIPHQAFQPLDLRLALGDRGILSRPLPDERPRRSVLVQQADKVVTTRL